MKIYVLETNMTQFFVISVSAENAVIIFIEKTYLSDPLKCLQMFSYCLDEETNQLSICCYRGSYFIEKCFLIREIEIREGYFF